MSRIEVERESGQLRELSLLSIRDAPVQTGPKTPKAAGCPFDCFPWNWRPTFRDSLPARSDLSSGDERICVRPIFPGIATAWVAVPEESYQAPSTPAGNVSHPRLSTHFSASLPEPHCRKGHPYPSGRGRAGRLGGVQGAMDGKGPHPSPAGFGFPGFPLVGGKSGRNRAGSWRLLCPRGPASYG